MWDKFYRGSMKNVIKLRGTYRKGKLEKSFHIIGKRIIKRFGLQIITE